jgi:ribonuclease R
VKFAKGQVLAPRIFNHFLGQAEEKNLGELASQVVLRSQSRAEYASGNHGHFGLALPKYCHFTSPIRRYSDLCVHRALIKGLKLGDGGLENSPDDLDDIAKRINGTERVAVQAERDTIDRFTTAFLADQVGERVTGRISGVIKNGLFLTLDGTLADGYVPARLLPDDRYQFNEKRRMLKGQHSRLEFHLGDRVEAIIREANPVSGSLTLEINDPPEK